MGSFKHLLAMVPVLSNKDVAPVIITLYLLFGCFIFLIL